MNRLGWLRRIIVSGSLLAGLTGVAIAWASAQSGNGQATSPDDPALADLPTLHLSQAQESPIERALHPRVSVDTEIVKVRFGNTVYAIPRNYLAGVTQPRDGIPYAAFTIQVLLPDFAPRTPQNAAQFDEVGWHDQLRALFQYGKIPRPREDVLKFYLDISKHAENNFRAIGDYKLYELPNNVPNEIYTKDTPNGLFLFDCEQEYEFKIRISPSCTVFEDFGNNVGVTYHFGRQHLMEAADIDLKLRSLLRSFVSQ
jgi:hypothetical protein